VKRTILFDLGGVLVDWNPRYLYRKVFPEPEMEFFLREVCTDDWNRSLDAGRPFQEAAGELQAAWPAYAQAIAWWDSRWEEMLKGPISGSVELLQALRDAGHPLYALTNWSARTFPIARNRFPFFGWFRDIVVSGEVGLVKPDPAIFRLAARRCGLEPARTVFVDDSRANVEAAKVLGFAGLHFTGAEDLRKGLEELGEL
jgi:2-haloacid dehalogenase